jgi:hypothetical protein
MATRDVADVSSRTDKCTEFQLHTKRVGNLVDFTLFKLVRYAAKAKDPQQKMMILTLIEDYKNGVVAVAWRRSCPVPIRVTRDT